MLFGVSSLPGWRFLLTAGILFALLGGVSSARAEFGKVNVFVGTNQGLGGLQAKLSAPVAVVALPDGSVLIADTSNDRVLRVAPDGATVSTYAGTGQKGATIDPQSASNTQLNCPYGLVVLPDESVLIADSVNQRVLRVAADGTVTLFAGTGQQGATIDPQSASNTQLNYPGVLAVLPDESVLIADSSNHRVLKIAANGTVTLFAGTGQQGDRLDPQSASNTQLRYSTGLAVLPNESVLITDNGNHRVLRVTTDGAVSLFAGTGQAGHRLDLPSAINTQLDCPYGLAVLPNESVLITDSGNHRVLRVAAGGMVSIFAGTGQEGATIDPQSAANTQFNYSTGLAVLPDGSVLIVDGGNQRVLIVSPDDHKQQMLQQLVDQGKEAIKQGAQGESKLKEVLFTLQTLTRPPEAVIRSLNKRAAMYLEFLPGGVRGEARLYKELVKYNLLPYLKPKSGYQHRAQLALNSLNQ